MLTLIIDTATKIGSVALFHDEIGLIGEININAKTNHSALIIRLIDSLFSLTDYKIEEIDRICVTLGPGSFTGIRVGVSAAKGLAISLNKKILGINELDLLANTLEHPQYEVISMIDARKERVYYCKYNVSHDGVLEKNIDYQVGEVIDFLNTLDNEKKYLFVGDGANIYKDLITEVLKERAQIVSLANTIPRAGVAGKFIGKMQDDNLHTLEPYYVSKSQAERMRKDL
ncbi:tRNA (adenosine(37)-N6)-threonylcarbamoyltransferase complex dimerization subunit type 1 TsaB [Fusobacterium sp. PH5-44]|uniref:tRNA (adenosine(37)-N6)-threonylcarbamoyltransferase complex dimerization subunit type 1 TsaB n=1 Tax=unclassified Fusobacterium TaxID=2648384 RepID=UPI003D25D536